jgi:NAD(P)H-hydrate epimerase
MIDVLLAEDVRRQDAAAAAAGTPVEALMERAGWAVARAARGMMGGTYGRRVVVLCGKGNNGGDGLVAARILRHQGAHVVAVLVTGEAMSEAAKANLQRFRGPVVGIDRVERELARADLVIDAMLGVGATRAPEGGFAEAIAALGSRREPAVLAIDVPTGVDTDTGAVPARVVLADRTVTLGGLKPGLLFEPGSSCAGDIEVADIGAPHLLDTPAFVLDDEDLAELIPQRGPGSHKRNAGTVLIVAGSRAMPGAAALTTGAAVHAGAGLTILCAPEDVCATAVDRVAEATTIPVPASAEGAIDAKALDLLMPRLAEADVLAIGPGLTTHAGTVELVRALVAEADLPVVLDADGLNAVADATDILRGRSAHTVITPHAGELARLTGRTSADLEADRLGAARAAAEDLGVTVVFKGPGTVIADFTGRYVNVSGGAALAQGGTGDVLTGLIASFLAQGMRAAQTKRASHRAHAVRLVAAAVATHGLAADRIAARIAPHPANAGALIDELGPAMHEVLHA